MSNPNPEPGETVSVRWTFFETDDIAGPFFIDSPTTGDVVDGTALPPAGSALFTLRPPIPPGSVLPPIDGAGGHNRVFVETGIIIPAGIQPGTYAYRRNWNGPLGEINGGGSAFAAFTIEQSTAPVRVIGTAVPNFVTLGTPSGSIRITWTVTLEGAQAVALTSPRSTVDGRILGGPLTANNALGSVTFTEVLSLPQDLVESAVLRGRGAISISRTFSASGESVTGQAVININATLLSSVSGISAVTNLQIGFGAIIPITWGAELRRFGAGSTIEIRSSRGLFTLPDGRSISSPINTLVSQVVSPGPTGLTLLETLSVPRSVAQLAFRAGFNEVLFTREFTDGLATASGTVRMAIVAPGSTGELLTSHIELHFDDQSVRKVVSPGDQVIAIAEVTHHGFGRLEGQWEIAAPPSTLGDPLFTPIKIERRQLAGAGVATFTSPPLPAIHQGSYLVRFLLTNTELEQIAPEILYVVGGPQAILSPIYLIAPLPGAVFTPSTQFEWQSVPLAAAYLLELLPWPRPPVSEIPLVGENVCADLTREERNAEPIAGMYVGPESTQTRLSALALATATLGRAMEPGEILCWRVSAVGSEGIRIAEGSLRTLYVGPIQVVPAQSVVRMDELRLQGPATADEPDEPKIPDGTEIPGGAVVRMDELRLAGPSAEIGEPGAELGAGTVTIRMDELVLRGPGGPDTGEIFPEAASASVAEGTAKFKEQVGTTAILESPGGLVIRMDELRLSGPGAATGDSSAEPGAGTVISMDELELRGPGGPVTGDVLPGAGRASGAVGAATFTEQTGTVTIGQFPGGIVIRMDELELRGPRVPVTGEIITGAGSTSGAADASTFKERAGTAAILGSPGGTVIRMDELELRGPGGPVTGEILPGAGGASGAVGTATFTEQVGTATIGEFPSGIVIRMDELQLRGPGRPVTGEILPGAGGASDASDASTFKEQEGTAAIARSAGGTVIRMDELILKYSGATSSGPDPRFEENRGSFTADVSTLKLRQRGASSDLEDFSGVVTRIEPLELKGLAADGSARQNLTNGRSANKSTFPGEEEASATDVSDKTTGINLDRRTQFRMDELMLNSIDSSGSEKSTESTGY